MTPQHRRTTVNPPNRPSPVTTGAEKRITPAKENLHEFRAESRLVGLGAASVSACVGVLS